MAVVKVTGLKECLKALKNAGDDFEELKDANNELAKDIASKAAAIAPRLTGNLASSIKGNRAKNKVSVKSGSSKVPYAGVQEYGWPARNIAAQSYIRRAAAENMDSIMKTYEDNIKSIIKKYDLN